MNRTTHLLALGLLLVVGGAVFLRRELRRDRPIRVVVIQSLSGTMRPYVAPVVDATRMAIAELNERGGVRGRRLEEVVVDDSSDPRVAARALERALGTGDVAAVFGCWTSACRKSVRPVVERHGVMLFYPLQYEGLEDSPNIVYTGAAPNQQIIPALKWSLVNFGPRVFLIGSDYVFPRAANAIIRLYAERWRGQVVGEAYVPLGSGDVEAVVAAIAAARPDVILNTINGTTNSYFFAALGRAGIGPRSPHPVPVLSLSIPEGSLTAPLVGGSYVAWNYFQGIDAEANREFLHRFRLRYGAARVVNDPMESAYVSVFLFAGALTAATSRDADGLRRALANQAFAAPGGMLFVDGATLHTWKTARIGRFQPEGPIEAVWASARPIPPMPYPPGRTKAQWEDFLRRLYMGWGGNWSAPVSPAGGGTRP